MKKIMILGAGIYQVPLIRTARRMGLYTIVVSIPGDYPGFALADKIYELNTRDKEAILAAAEKQQIDGIYTSGTDVAVSTIGYVCEKMHLSGIPYEAAEILTDKAKMKDAFRQGGVSAADGMRVRSAEEAQKAAEQLGYPVVIKRVDSSGSRGITVVVHSGQIEEAYENKIALKEFELKALTAQINPHFLYNSLSIINWMAIKSRQKEISRVTLALSTFYRTALSKGLVRLAPDLLLEPHLQVVFQRHDDAPFPVCRGTPKVQDRIR